MASFLNLAILIVVLNIVYTVGCLIKNIRIAQKTGLRYYILPTAFWTNYYGIIFMSGPFQYVLNNLLPGWLEDKVNNSFATGRWKVKDRLFEKMGGCYVKVTPGGAFLDVSDADVARQILQDRHQFPKPAHSYDVLKIYGENIVASDNKNWPRHRHHAAPAFNDKNNVLVWQEAIKQTAGMMEELRGGDKHADFVLPSTQSYMNRIILQVLASAAFGVDLPYTSPPWDEKDNNRSIFEDSATPPKGYRATFRSVMQYMSYNIGMVALMLGILPKWMPHSWLPHLKTELGAYEDLRNYLDSLVTVAKANDASGAGGGNGSNNLLQLLVRSNEAKETGKDYRLTPDEIIGNLHIFTVAGFETTATTLRFSLVLLALHPEKQRWLREQIKEALKDQPEDPAQWYCPEVFPKLVAPLCVMLETLRLFPPVVTVPKWTGDSSSNIEFEGNIHSLPAKMSVQLNANAIHYRKDYWGPDSHDFVPERWDANNKSSFLTPNYGVEGVAAPGLEYPSVHKPVRGAFFPFSDGNRSCLGKKFAQVEYVAVLSLLFHDYEVSLAKGSSDESYEKVVERAQKALGGSFGVIALVMKGDLPLLFRRIDGEKSNLGL